MVLHGVLKTIARQLSLPGVDERTAVAAWKRFFADRLWPGRSSEDVLRRDDWHTAVLRIESWAAARGVTFAGSEAA